MIVRALPRPARKGPAQALPRPARRLWRMHLPGLHLGSGACTCLACTWAQAHARAWLAHGLWRMPPHAARAHPCTTAHPATAHLKSPRQAQLHAPKDARLLPSPPPSKKACTYAKRVSKSKQVPASQPLSMCLKQVRTCQPPKEALPKHTLPAAGWLALATLPAQGPTCFWPPPCSGLLHMCTQRAGVCVPRSLEHACTQRASMVAAAAPSRPPPVAGWPALAPCAFGPTCARLLLQVGAPAV